MKPHTFKTNIKCSGCVAQVTPHLNEAAGKDNWSIDLQDPEKLLTIEGPTDEAKIREAIERAGFTIETIR